MKAGDQAEFAGPVMAYMGVISAMVVTAFGAGNPFGIGGALSFYASDATLGWNKFVAEIQPRPPRRDGHLPPRPVPPVLSPDLGHRAVGRRVSGA